MSTVFLMDLIMLQSAFQSPRFRGIIGGAWNGFKMKLLVSVSASLFWRDGAWGIMNHLECTADDMYTTVV